MILTISSFPRTNPVITAGWTYLWEDHHETEGFETIADLVELHRHVLREKMLQWIYDFEKLIPEAARSRRHVDGSDGRQYWWFSEIALKDPWRSAEFGFALKLLAVEQLLFETQPESLKLDLKDRKATICISQIASAHGIPVSVGGLGAVRLQAIKIRYLLTSLMVPYLAARGVIGFLRFVVARWGLRHQYEQKDKSCREILICNYFANFSVDLNREDLPKFSSQFWGELPDLLRSRGWNICWLHIFMNKNPIGESQRVRGAVQSWNATEETGETHNILEAGLSVRIVLETLAEGLWVWTRIVRPSTYRQVFPPLGADIDSKLIFGPLWLKQYASSDFLVSVLRQKLFREYFKGRAPQDLALYLYESQSWERGLLFEWRNQANAPIVGVFHYAPKFWDLRLYNPLEVNQKWDVLKHPLPDLLAVNSPSLLETLSRSGVNRNRMQPIEALRYLHESPNRDSEGVPAVERGARVLILTDFRSEVTGQMINKIRQLDSATTRRFKWSIKFHPNYQLSEAQLGFQMKCEIVRVPLSEALSEADFVLTSSDTSASIDAAMAGCHVIIIRDPATLNFSPMLGDPQATFAASEVQIKNILLGEFKPYSANADSGYFFVGKDLERWKHLLDILEFDPGVHGESNLSKIFNQGSQVGSNS